MKKITFYLLCFCLIGCGDIENIQLADNPFDFDFEGDIIQILQISDKEPLNNDSCKPSVDIQFIPEIYNRMNEILGPNEEKLISIYFTINGEETDIINSNGSLVNFGNGVFDPGISDLSVYDEFEIYKIEFSSNSMVINANEAFELNVIFLVREKFNSNAANRKNYIKQSITLECS